MPRGNPARSDGAVLGRTRWVIPPLAGRLVPLAVSAAENDVDATLYAVTTGGLSQRQIDDTRLPAENYLSLLTALLTLPRALLRHLTSSRKFGR